MPSITLNPALRGQLDSQERRILREWFTHTVAIFVPEAETNDESEQIYVGLPQTPDYPQQRCYVTEGSDRRIILPTGQVIPVNFEVVFDRELPIEENWILRNAQSRSAWTYFTQVRVAAVEPYHSPDKAVLVKVAQCLKY